MTVTLKDIAQHAGLSIGTISQILNGRPGYLPETCERVRAIAHKLGYRPNAYARSVQSGRFGNVGLMLPANPDYGFLIKRLLQGLEESLAEQQAHLSIFQIHEGATSKDGALLPKALRERLVDGMIFNQHFALPSNLDERLARERMPLAHINNEHAWGAILPDDRGGAMAATLHLLRLGHRRIAFQHWYLGPNSTTQHFSDRDRGEGYRKAMQSAGLEPRFIWRDGGLGPTHGVPFTREILAAPDRPTAIVAYSENVANTVAMAATCQGLKIGTDLSLVAFSDDRIWTPCGYIDSWCIDGRAMGAATVAVLMQQWEDPGCRPANRSVPMTPMLFDSCRSPNLT